jgi:hypothetical protein
MALVCAAVRALVFVLALMESTKPEMRKKA